MNIILLKKRKSKMKNKTFVLFFFIGLSKKKYFKSFTLNKIRDLTRQIMRIIETFNDNVVFK